MEECREQYEELILTTFSYVWLVYAGYIINSLVLLKNCYKEFTAETEKDKLKKL